MTVTVAFDLSLLYLVAVNIIAILAYVLLLKQRTRRQERNTRAVSSAIVEYFRADGIEVTVEAVPRPGGKSYIAFVESEPMKRFRYSHIIEITLRMHVQHECGGVDLERVFWRFPIHGKGQEAEDAVREMEMTDREQDEYLREGLDLKKQKGYDISESSWEEFQKTLTRNAKQRQ